MSLADIFRRRFLFDGAFGTMLMRADVPLPPCPEMASVACPKVVEGIHEAYAKAGAMVLTANTFGANPITLRKYDLEGRYAELVQASVGAARGFGCPVALDMGPTGGLLAPMGDLTASAVYEAYRLEAQAGEAAGADLIIIETMGDIAEARLAALAAVENTNLPVITSFSFENGRLMTGGTPETAAAILSRTGIRLLGTNCSGGPDELLDAVKTMRAHTHLPILAQPNAGIPSLENGKTVYPLSAQEMAPKMRALLEAGAAGIGGCCGTTPEHIALFAPLLGAFDEAVLSCVKTSLPATARGTVPLQEALSAPAVLAPDPDAAYDFDPDATLACLNLDGLTVKQAEELIAEVQQVLRVPLWLTGTDEAVVRHALLCYCGNALVGLSHLDGVRGAIYQPNPL